MDTQSCCFGAGEEDITPSPAGTGRKCSLWRPGAAACCVPVVRPVAAHRAVWACLRAPTGCRLVQGVQWGGGLSCLARPEPALCLPGCVSGIPRPFHITWPACTGAVPPAGRCPVWVGKLGVLEGQARGRAGLPGREGRSLDTHSSPSRRDPKLAGLSLSHWFQGSYYNQPWAGREAQEEAGA